MEHGYSTAESPEKRLFNFACSNQQIVLFVARNHEWANLDAFAGQQLNGQAMVARYATSMTREIFSQRPGKIGMYV